LIGWRFVDPIPSSVKEFLHKYIDSVDKLEILRVISSEPGASFTSDSLAKTLHSPVEEIERHLATLLSNALLTTTGADPVAWKYGAGSPEIEKQLQALMKTYLERPVTLIKLVSDNQRKLRLFADAFRLKKED
jgi:hypothetical protein